MTLFAPAIGQVWKTAENSGVDPDRLFEKASIDPKLRLDVTARVTEKQTDDLLCLAQQNSHDDTFVFRLVDHLHPSYLGAIGLAWLTSASLRTAFERLVRYVRLVTDELGVCTEDKDGEFRVIFEPGSFKSRDPALRELLRMANPVKMCRMTYGESFSPGQLQFQQSEPSNVQAYYEFFRCKLIFSADESMLAIPIGVADEPLSGFNPQLVQHLDQMIIDYLAKMDKSDIVSRAKSEILHQLPSGSVSLESVALALNLSSRTLNRKLKEKNESFKSLLASTRRELSEKYILDKSLSLTEISFLLGFSETSSFSRAYRSWTGKSPSAFRKEA